jgi:hypothetical protein
MSIGIPISYDISKRVIVWFIPVQNDIKD